MPELSNTVKCLLRTYFHNNRFRSYLEIQKKFNSFWSQMIMPYCKDSEKVQEISEFAKTLTPSVLPFVHFVKSPWYKRIIGIRSYAYLDLDGVEELAKVYLSKTQRLENNYTQALKSIEKLKKELSEQTEQRKDSNLQHHNHDEKYSANDRFLRLLELIQLIYADLYKINNQDRSESDILLVNNYLSEISFEIIEYRPGINDDEFTIKRVSYIQEQYMESPTIVDKSSNEVIFKGIVYTPIKHE